MKTIYAIPGLATTGELFKYIKLNNALLKTLEWPPIIKGETMQSYARKFLKQIDETKSFALLGVSFGGMLCSELALITKPERTILISSCKCANELPAILKLFSKIPVYNIMSDKILKGMAINSRLILGFDKKFMPEFEEMVFSMERDYLKYSMDCIVNWDNTNCHRKDITHIHGDADRLLVYRSVKADYTIRGGTHAMIINNAREINTILNSLL